MKKCNDDTVIIAYQQFPWDSPSINIKRVFCNLAHYVYYYDVYCDIPDLVYVCKLSAAKSEVLQELYR